MVPQAEPKPTNRILKSWVFQGVACWLNHPLTCLLSISKLKGVQQGSLMFRLANISHLNDFMTTHFKATGLQSFSSVILTFFGKGWWFTAGKNCTLLQWPAEELSENGWQLVCKLVIHWQMSVHRELGSLRQEGIWDNEPCTGPGNCRM